MRAVSRRGCWRTPAMRERRPPSAEDVDESFARQALARLGTLPAPAVARHFEAYCACLSDAAMRDGGDLADRSRTGASALRAPAGTTYLEATGHTDVAHAVRSGDSSHTSLWMRRRFAEDHNAGARRLPRGDEDALGRAAVPGSGDGGRTGSSCRSGRSASATRGPCTRGDADSGVEICSLMTRWSSSLPRRCTTARSTRWRHRGAHASPRGR